MKPWTLIEGECLPALHGMPDNSVDACITDPPYSSGGFSRDDKGKDPDAKYTQSSAQGRYPPLAHGATARVGRLRAYGNAIVAQVASEMIAAYLECRP